jgi:hypothetical protein
MTPKELIKHVRELGVELSPGEPGRLKCFAPPGVLSGQMRQALTEMKPEILDLLQAERISSRRIVTCRECENYISMPAMHRASWGALEMPGGCTEGRTSPDSRPPIFPFTGWYCDAWIPKRVH